MTIKAEPLPIAEFLGTMNIGNKSVYLIDPKAPLTRGQQLYTKPILSNSTEELEKALQKAIETLEWYANGNHRETLSGRINWKKERNRLAASDYLFEGESPSGDEYYVENGKRAEDTVKELRSILPNANAS